MLAHLQGVWYRVTDSTLLDDGTIRVAMEIPNGYSRLRFKVPHRSAHRYVPGSLVWVRSDVYRNPEEEC